jgi:glucose-6-phosphate-specific signal transduction histidine kinase
LVAEINLEQPERSPIENLKHFLDNWNGVIEITHNLNDVTIPERLEKSVEEIVMEAVNNAVRHGEASWVTIEVKPSQGGVGLRVENDSKSISEGFRAGLGTKTFDRLAPASWSWQFMEDAERGPILHVEFHLADQTTGASQASKLK